MAASSETLRRDRQVSSGAWAILVLVGLVAVALAIGGYVISTRSTSEPIATTEVVESDTVASAGQQEGGLIKNGLQPRPYSAIEVPPQIVTTPEGFVRVGTDFRPIPFEQGP